jgi:myo-inositol 2-dehydrogenase/D-chiro-inositol 1-dehydrogenase
MSHPLDEKRSSVKVLVFGAGRMGAIRVEDLAADSRVTEVLVTNRNPQRATDLATQFGATAVPWESASEPIADAVVVAVGTDAHATVLSNVLPQGIPVLCEKPIADTLEATEAAIELAQSSGSPLQIGFQRRFDEPIRAVHNAIQSGELGTVYSLTMTAHDHTPSAREFIAGSGGIFRDMHVHDFDLVRWLTGSEVDRVFATKAVREHLDYADFDDADVSSVIAVTTSGVQVIITGTRHDALGHDIRLEAFGSKDSVSAGLNARTPLRTIEGELGLNKNPYSGFVDRFRDSFRNETHAFVSFVRGDIANPCPPDSALESLRIAIACERSIATGTAVRVSDVR